MTIPIKISSRNRYILVSPWADSERCSRKKVGCQSLAVSPRADREPKGINWDSSISLMSLQANSERRKKGGMVTNIRQYSSSQKGPETEAREPRGNSQDLITDITIAISY
jgi:hypothetical protein